MRTDILTIIAANVRTAKTRKGLLHQKVKLNQKKIYFYRKIYCGGTDKRSAPLCCFADYDSRPFSISIT